MHTVLVVDDEADILDLIAFNLQRQGLKVLTARDGLSAVFLAKEHQPDLIVLDLMLPGRDGFGVFKDLRGDTRTSQIPVIMLTARGELDDLLGLAAHGLGQIFTVQRNVLSTAPTPRTLGR